MGGFNPEIHSAPIPVAFLDADALSFYMKHFMNALAISLVDESGTAYGIKHVGNKPRVIATPYFVEIAKGNVPAHVSYNKFGQNLSVPATLEDIWDGSEVYEYLADDTFATMYISSDNAGDSGDIWEVQGIDSDYNYSTVEVTTSGFTFVALTSGAADDKWWRVFRALNKSAVVSLGNIYISKDNTDIGGNGIPDNTDDIQAKILTGNEQTFMSLFTVPGGKTAYVTRFYASTSSNKITDVHLLVRPFGGVFNVKAPISINQGRSEHPYDFPLVVTAKSDIAVRASAVGAGGIVSAGFDLWYE